MLYIDKTADSYLQFEKSFSGLGSQHKESNKYLNDHITLQTRAGAFRVLWPQTQSTTFLPQPIVLRWSRTGLVSGSHTDSQVEIKMRQKRSIPTRGTVHSDPKNQGPE